MNEVVMKKDELIRHLTENKAKHDVVLATAIEGYWDTAKEKIERRKAKFSENIKEYTDAVNAALDKVTSKIEKREEVPSKFSVDIPYVDTSFDLVYPQDHSNDYERAIRMMRSSIYEDVRLTIQEYDAYVLNNWSWKTAFLTSNRLYVENSRSRGKVAKLAGPINVDIGGTDYENAYLSATAAITAGGVNSF